MIGQDARSKIKPLNQFDRYPMKELKAFYPYVYDSGKKRQVVVAPSGYNTPELLIARSQQRVIFRTSRQNARDREV